MSPVTEQRFQEALALPEDERFELIDALLASQGPSERLAFDPEWRDEIQRRSAELDAGRAQCAPWPIVRDRVRRRGNTGMRG